MIYIKPDVTPLPNSSTPCAAIWTPFKHGVSMMMGIVGEYTSPEPPPTDGGTPVSANVVPFRKKETAVGTNVNYSSGYKKAA